jgi:DNA-binding NarL/FixJ family response regulator
MLGQERSALPRPRALRLLIVDKEPAARCAFMHLCQPINDLHIVGEVGSGGAAIHAVEDLAPDVMLIDLALPDMSGFDVLRLAGNSMGALGITTSHQPEYAERAIAEGAVDHLVKPVSADRFDHAIRRVRQRCDFGQAAESRLVRHILHLLNWPTLVS